MLLPLACLPAAVLENARLFTETERRFQHAQTLFEFSYRLRYPLVKTLPFSRVSAFSDPVYFCAGFSLEIG